MDTPPSPSILASLLPSAPSLLRALGGALAALGQPLLTEIASANRAAGRAEARADFLAERHEQILAGAVAQAVAAQPAPVRQADHDRLVADLQRAEAEVESLRSRLADAAATAAMRGPGRMSEETLGVLYGALHAGFPKLTPLVFHGWSPAEHEAVLRWYLAGHGTIDRPQILSGLS